MIIQPIIELIITNLKVGPGIIPKLKFVPAYSKKTVLGIILIIETTKIIETTQQSFLKEY